MHNHFQKPLEKRLPFTICSDVSHAGRIEQSIFTNWHERNYNRVYYINEYRSFDVSAEH